MPRKTYEKYQHIDKVFDRLEAMIVSKRDRENLRKDYFYLNDFHRQNYEALLLYYGDASENPLMDGACYILGIPEIFEKINIFDYAVPLDFVFNNGELSESFKSIDVYYQYLIAAALEVSDVQIFKPSGFAMGMNHWNITVMKLFWQYTTIIRLEAL
ncbi:DUF2538 family protein [Macrococcus armenti]|uniref:DUF2538 family protein n=1 Tax=Macrococcus armenti TaxID=2875764 RepID=UPI001CC99241|nr:DUF2538 family protein [Macrococcus armenti]UBH16099.1 DUF2538 family protein [Macrococcus armenti]UBH18459.1 DUF2538 family protein [Macrococcus armenti]UBH20726.1 DUF2538 family protein [Macrococcus armenti]